MLEPETIRRLREFQSRWAPSALCIRSVNLEAWGQVVGIAPDQFDALLEAAELGMHIRAAADILLPAEQVRYAIREGGPDA